MDNGGGRKEERRGQGTPPLDEEEKNNKNAPARQQLKVAPDARRDPGRVDVEAAAVAQRAHERVRDLGLALAAEWWSGGVDAGGDVSAAACSAWTWSDEHAFSLECCCCFRERGAVTRQVLYCSIS